MKRVPYFIIGLVFVLGVNLYLRTLTINFPQLKGQARQIVEEKIQNIATQTIKKTYSDFSALTQGRLAEVFVSQYKKDHQKGIKKQIQDEYIKLKSHYQDNSGQTYLLEIDCWNWARYTQNVLLFGHPGDKVVDGHNLDILMLSPFGGSLMWNHFLFRLSAFLYKLFCLFWPIPLFSFLFYLPLFFTTIFFIILYLIAYQYGGLLTALFACFYIGLAPDFLLHSSAGWFDMDILSLLLPLLVISSYAYAAKAGRVINRFFLVILSSFCTGLFSYTWTGWWFIFLVIITYELYSFANLFCGYIQFGEKNFILFRKHAFNVLLFTLGSLFFILIFCGRAALDSIPYLGREVARLNNPLSASLWPNVYVTVSEIGRIDFAEISEAGGNVILFFIALVFVLLFFFTTVRQRKSEGFKREFAIMTVFWFIGLFFACLKGRRFILFLYFPLGLSLGWGISRVYSYLKDSRKRLIAYFFLACMFILLGRSFIYAYQQANRIFPFMNDAWFKVLSDIRDKTPKAVVINSWWDYGAWFKTVAGRRVIFDGQSQNIPQAYWMAYALLSNNEEEAVSVLRMLNNGGNRAFDVINGQLNDPLRSMLLLKKVLTLKAEAAKKELLSLLPGATAEEVKRLVFDKPQKAYFIVDNTMCNKMGSISYLGSWNFIKAYLAGKTEGKKLAEAEEYLLKIKALKKNDIEKFSKEAALAGPEDLGEIVSSRFKIYSRLLNGQEKDGLVLFDRGFVLRPKEQLVYLYSSRLERFRIPKSLFVFDNNQMKEAVFSKNDLDLSFLTFKDKQEYRAVLLEGPLADSLFVRLYFLNAAGLRYFKPFIEEKVSDGFIRVFEIIWE